MILKLQLTTGNPGDEPVYTCVVDVEEITNTALLADFVAAKTKILGTMMADGLRTDKE